MASLACAALWSAKPAPERGPGPLRPDRALLWRLPDQALEQDARRTPLDADGLRASARSEGPRVLLLGDEEVFAAGAPLEQTLHQQIAERLSAAGVEGEVLNGAVPGYSVLQTRAWLDAQGWDLEPDLLLIAPGLSDCSPAEVPDAALMACMARTGQRLRWAWSTPAGAQALLDQMRGALTPAMTSLCPLEASTTRRVPAPDYAAALDALLLEAARRDQGVLLLLPDSPRAEGCTHAQLTRRVGTRRAVPTIELAAVNRAAGAWGRGARTPEGDPSPKATAAAAQAVVDLLLRSQWPGARFVPEMEAPPYTVTDRSR